MDVLVRALDYLQRSSIIWVVRVKVRFEDTEATIAGWREVMANVVSRDDPDLHLCEIQCVHGMLMRVRADMGAHDDYCEFRTAMELLEWHNVLYLLDSPADASF